MLYKAFNINSSPQEKFSCSLNKSVFTKNDICKLAVSVFECFGSGVLCVTALTHLASIHAKGKKVSLLFLKS